MMREWCDCCRRCKKATVVTDHIAIRTRCSQCGLEYHPIEDGVNLAENDTVRLGDPMNPFLSNSALSIVTTTEPRNGSLVDFFSLNLENSLKPGLDPVSIVTTELKNGSFDDLLSLTLGTLPNRGSDPVSIATTELKNGSFVDFLSLNLDNSLKPDLDPVSIVTTELKNGSLDDFLSLTLGTSPNRGSDPVSIATTELKNGSSDDFLSLTLGTSQKLGFAFDPISIATTKPNKASSDDVIVSIAEMSDRLELPPTVKDEANEIFKEVENYNREKERNVLFAACIYIACRYNDMTLSMGEISTVANEAPILDIKKTIGFIAEKLKMDKNWLMSIKAVDYIRRFCSELGLDSEAVKAAQEAAERYDNIDNSSRTPVSVAAGVVYAIARLSYEKNLLEGIIEVTGVTENTIKGTYEDLYPKLSTITPKWFAKPKDLKNLGSP